MKKMENTKVYKCATCGSEVKREIYLKTPLTEELHFCSMACLLYCLKEMCPATFEIKPKPIAYLVNKKVKELWTE